MPTITSTTDAEIFLSHATANDEIVTRIHDELEARTGRNIWVDHIDLMAGDEWHDEIETQLERCPKFLLAVSPASVKSKEVTAEWRRAIVLGHPILLAIIEPMPIKDIPSRLALFQWVELHKDWDGGLAALTNAIMKVRDDDAKTDVPDFSVSWPITGSIERKLTAIPMTGRENELAEVKRNLRYDPVSILGVGGLGKSRLAVEVVRTHDEVHGAIWHRASPTSTPEGVYLLLAEHFGLDPATPRAHILSQLRTHPRLVILDNAEDVPPEDPRHAEYLTLVESLVDHKAQVLLTSRLEWENVQPGVVVKLEELGLTEAAQIVMDMARVFNVDVKVIEPQAETIAQAALQHPRLIEWAVRQMRSFPVAKVMADLRGLKSKKAQDALDEMIVKTLRDMVKETEHGEKAAFLLTRLLTCRGGFTYEAAQVIGIVPGGDAPVRNDDTLDAALHLLTLWQFIAYDATRQRYTLDPLVLTAADAGALTVDETAYRAHFDYYEALARTHHEKQDYLGLDPESGNLEAAFEWAMRIEDYEQAYWMSNATSFFLANRGRFGQRLDWIERVVAALGDHSDKTLWSNAHISLGVVYKNHPLGSRRDNLSRAVAAYEAALVYRTPEAAPLDYAMTQNNLGTSYRQLSRIEAQADNLARAVAAYEAALVYWTPEAAPMYYATIQNNVGNVYSDLSAIEDPVGNLSRAIAAHKAALVYRTPEAVPLYYAMTQNNLGIAYETLSAIEDRAGNLSRAIASFEAALVYRTPEAAPLDYATTQNNLGAAYRKFSEIEDRTGNLSRAIAAYEAALVYRTPEAAPLSYAMTQGNLGLTHEDLGDLPSAIACWREAEKYFRQIDHVDNADMMRRWIDKAEAQLNAGSSGGAGAADEGESE